MRPNPVSIRGRRSAVLLLTLALVLTASMSWAKEPTFARCDTDSGSILIVLYSELAPNHVANFKHLAETDFYVGTKFHRVLPNFMIQGGDPLSKDRDPRNDGTGGPLVSDVLDERVVADALKSLNRELEKRGYVPLTALPARAELKAEFSETHHYRGTLSMARGGHSVDSAGSQFFICVADYFSLDGNYSVFGYVVDGMDVADRIVHGVPRRGAGQGAVVNPAAIRKISILEGTDDLTAAEKAAWDALPDERKNVK